METIAKKITLATVKSFIKKNKDKLFIRNNSTFDGMVDGVRPCEDKSFRKAVHTDSDPKYTLGVEGAYFVSQSRDWFNSFNDDKYTGIAVSNCCGSFVLAIEK